MATAPHPARPAAPPIARRAATRTPTRAPIRALCAVLFAAAAATVWSTTVGAAPAHADDGYTYWNYFHLADGQWEFAQTGPSGATPEDGAVEGYRYGTSTTSQGITPRADLEEVTFAAICAGQDAGAGEKRVGVVLDYGVAADAADGETPPQPRGACAVVAADADGQQVLESVADVRFQEMVCGIDGYPVKGCSLTVKDAVVAEQENVAFELPAAASEADQEPTSSAPSEDEGGTGVWAVAGIALVVLLIAGGGLAMSRRAKSRT